VCVCVCIAIYNSLASQFVTKLHDILSGDAVVRECINKFLAIFTRTESHAAMQCVVYLTGDI
jgi:hypothetical protein